MSTKVIERPPQYSFSKNEIRYKFLTNNLAPANLFVQVELYARRLRSNSILNWTCDQLNHPLVDANLFIDVNGNRVVSEYNDNSGTLNLKEGDVVKVTMPIYTEFPVEFGIAYQKLVIKKDADEMYNDYNSDADEANWVTYTFNVEANKTYTVFGYTRLDTTVPKEDTLDMPVVVSYTLVKTFNLKPDNAGNTHLYIDAFLDSMIIWSLPDLNTVFSNASEQCCEFYIRFREVSAATPDPEWIATEADHKRIALKGGIEKQKVSRNNFFNYQNVAKSFFTWMPSGRFFATTERSYLSVLIKTPGTYKLKKQVYLVAGGDTIEEVVELPFVSGTFYHINTGFGALGIDALAVGENVFYYEVSILDALDQVVYAPHRFYIEYRPVYDYFDLVYHNSLGGFDGVRVRGETTIGLEKEVVGQDGGLSNARFDAGVKVGESSQYISKRDTYKGNIGFLRNSKHQEALQDLLISSSLYQFSDARFVPVLNIQKGADLRKTTDTLYSFPIEWQIPFDNDRFTPKHINLGIGTETEVYE